MYQLSHLHFTNSQSNSEIYRCLGPCLNFISLLRILEKNNDNINICDIRY